MALSSSIPCVRQCPSSASSSECLTSCQQSAFMDRQIVSAASLNFPSNANSTSYNVSSYSGRQASEASRQVSSSSLGSSESCWWLMAGLSPDPPVSTSQPNVSSASNPLMSRRASAVEASEDLNDSALHERAIFLNGVSADWSPKGASNGASIDTAELRVLKPLSIADLQPHLISNRLRVAYQGVPGAYSEGAASKAYPECETVPCEQFEVAFQAVEQWLVDRAVLPIENSLGGSIHRNYDLLLRHRLHIVGEVQIAINHCLLGLPGAQIGDLRRVLSHPQALAQCEGSLVKLGVSRESVYDTAGAAEMVASRMSKELGAVASLRAAKLYGLDVLATGIQDDVDNITRFLILSREPVMPGMDGLYKTSIVFALEIGPGVLFKALSVFALRDINLTKIESRPQKNKPLGGSDQPMSSKAKALVKEAEENGYHLFDYLFYIDFQASMAEPRAQHALRHLQEFTPFLRILGSYPMDASPIANL